MIVTVTLIIGAALIATATQLVINHRIKLEDESRRDYAEWREWVALMNNGLNRYTTPARAAKLAGVSKSTVYNWMNRDDRLPSIPDPRNPRRRLVREIDALQAERQARVRGIGRPRRTT